MAPTPNFTVTETTPQMQAYIDSLQNLRDHMNTFDFRERHRYRNNSDPFIDTVFELDGEVDARAEALGDESPQLQDVFREQRLLNARNSLRSQWLAMVRVIEGNTQELFHHRANVQYYDIVGHVRAEPAYYQMERDMEAFARDGYDSGYDTPVLENA